MRARHEIFGWTLLIFAACANPAQPIELSPSPPSDPRERHVDDASKVLPPPMEEARPTDQGNFPLPPLDEPSELADTEKDLPVVEDMTPESTLWSGVAILRRVDDATAVGTVAIAEAPDGARLTIALNAEPSLYAVDISRGPAECSAGNLSVQRAGSFAISRGQRRGTLDVNIPARLFGRDYGRLAGRALLIRPLNAKTPFACGSVEMTRGDLDVAG
jgi:hypothetical protein